MAKGKGNKPAAATAATGAGHKTINRKKRNALERKCLPQSFKNLFRGESRESFRSLLKAWQDGRKKTSEKAE